MAEYFFDASAIVKHYFAEPGSLWVRQLIDERDESNNAPVNGIYVSDTSTVEVPAAIAVLRRNNRLSKRRRDETVSTFFRDMGTRFEVVPVYPATFVRAALLTQQHPLKAYDAIQLAIGLAVNEVCQSQAVQLTFVSSDRQLLAAARAEGLVVEDPHDHL